MVCRWPTCFAATWARPTHRLAAAISTSETSSTACLLHQSRRRHNGRYNRRCAQLQAESRASRCAHLDRRRLNQVRRVSRSMNFAAVQHLPMIVSFKTTKWRWHSAGAASSSSFLNWAAAYGVEGGSFDGNTCLTLTQQPGLLRFVPHGARARVVDADTFRMGGHATHDDARRGQRLTRRCSHTGQARPIGLRNLFDREHDGS